MKIIVPAQVWDNARMGENLEFARSAYYLGYTHVMISRMVGTNNQDETRSVAETATRLGIRRDDTIERQE